MAGAKRTRISCRYILELECFIAHLSLACWFRLSRLKRRSGLKTLVEDQTGRRHWPDAPQTSQPWCTEFRTLDVFGKSRKARSARVRRTHPTSGRSLHPASYSLACGVSKVTSKSLMSNWRTGHARNLDLRPARRSSMPRVYAVFVGDPRLGLSVKQIA